MGIPAKLLNELSLKGQLPASRFSSGAREGLRTPLNAGLLEFRRQGPGEVLAVLNPGSFRIWLESQFPALSGAHGAASPRAANIALHRDSKRGRRGLDHFPVLARAHGPLDPAWGPALGTILQATEQWGAAAILLDLSEGDDRVESPALPPGLRVMTLEAPETFRHSERLRAHADLFLLGGTGGRLRRGLLLWLARQPDLRVIHFGDLDPVGLQEFTRLLALMPGRVTLHLPGDLEARFRTFANRALLDAPRNREILAALPRGLSPEMDRVLDLMARYGPLEQECDLIDPTPSPTAASDSMDGNAFGRG